MSSPINVQLRRYTELFDAELTEISADDVIADRVPGAVAPLHARRRPLARPWLVAALSAVTAAALIGGVAVLLRDMSTGGGPAVTVPSAPTTGAVSPAPEAAEPAFDWVSGGPVSSGFAEIVHDGERFVLLESGGLRTSRDGIAWESAILESPGPATASAEWSDLDVHDGRLVRLVTNPGPARVYVIDVNTGVVREAILPVAEGSGLATSTDLRGFVAVGPVGLVAFLYDNAEGTARIETAGYFSRDGTAWTAIDEGPLLEGAIVQPAAITSGFVALSARSVTMQDPEAWYSPDGTDWERIETPTDATLPVGGLVSWGDGAWAYNESAFGPPSLSVNPTWLLGPSKAVEVRPDLAPLTTEVLGYGPAVGAGDLGLVAVFGVAAAPEHDESTAEWFVEVTLDGGHWTRVAFPDALGHPSGFMHPAVGTDRVLVLVRTDDDTPALAIGILPS